MPLSGKKKDIVQTGPGAKLDFQVADWYPFAVSSQRKIAPLPDGKLIAVFAKGMKIHLALSLDGGTTWKSTADIFSKSANAAMEYSFCPALTVDGQGFLHLAWRATGSGATSLGQLWYSKSPKPFDWTKPKQLPPVDPTAFHEYPAIGTGPKGEVYIAFACNGGLYCLTSKSYGDGWPKPKPIVAPSPGQAGDPSLAVASDGTVYVAFVGSVEGAMDLLFCAVSKDAAKSWKVFTVYAKKGTGAGQPSIAVDGQNLPVIAYAVDSGFSTRPIRAIQVARPPETDWTKPWKSAELDVVNTLKKAMRRPTLAIDKSGTRSVVYLASDETPLSWEEWPVNLRCQTSKDGVNWSGPFPITSSQNGQFAPQAWPNLYWQGVNAGQGLLVLWEGKAETASAPLEPWYLRAFRSDDFAI